jgi:hypothetical protein
MVKYKSTNVTSKAGINFVRTVVEESGSLFHKIEQENDLGIDALIEFVLEEQPLNKQVAIQIKSGRSYFSSDAGECIIPIDNHRSYWSSYPLPVVGVVYVPDLKQAYWVDIKQKLKNFPAANVIRFVASEINRLDGGTFKKIFLPLILRETPEISFEFALELSRSNKPDESYLGLITLFRRYPNQKETWSVLIEYFLTHPIGQIPLIFIYFLAHIPWHPDIEYHGDDITKETQEYVNGLLGRFGKSEAQKLLGLIDTENGIHRGSIGQSVEAIISSLPNSNKLLEQIAGDNSVEMTIREYAALILAMRIGKLADPTLRNLVNAGSWYADELSTHLNRYGALNPYS